MRKIPFTTYLIVALVYLLPLMLFAQEVLVPPTMDELQAFLVSLKGLKGASSLAAVTIVVQGGMLLMRSKLGEYAGKYRLLVVSLFTLLLGMGALVSQGMAPLAALMHSTTLAALQVFGHQLYNQFFTKKGAV